MKPAERSGARLAVVQALYEMEIAGKGVIDATGRKRHDAYLFEVKAPSASKHPGDFYTLKATIPAKDGRRAGDLLNRDFTAPAPNRTWVMDFTYCRTWQGFVYVSFIVDVFAQKVVAWHAATRLPGS